MEIRKQLGHILSVLIILSFIAAFVEIGDLNWGSFTTLLIIFAVILFVYIAAKKLTALYLQTEEDSKIWSFQRYWFGKHHYFSREVPIGIILPILVLIISMGTLPWYASLQSEVKPLKHKSVRRDGLLSFTEISENDISLISAAGVASVLILSFFAYLVNLPLLSRIAIHFAFFNMLPISSLDGSKIFFGNKPLWIVLAIITLIALLYSFFLV